MTNPISASLVQAVCLLARTAEDQLNELRRLGCPDMVDELALQFHDQAIMADQLFNRAEITEKEFALVKEIDRLLRDMSGEANALLWTPEALRSSMEWSQVRSLARESAELAR